VSPEYGFQDVDNKAFMVLLNSFNNNERADVLQYIGSFVFLVLF